MKFKNIFLFMILCFCLFSNNVVGSQEDVLQLPESSCDRLLEIFAANTATFTYCAIRNARPITFCESCVKEYIDVLQAYEEIFEMTDESGEACKIKLLNHDRLEIIEVIFKSVSELWGRGECDSCFVTTSNGTLTSDTRNTTKEFQRRYKVAKECIAEHSNDSAPVTVCTVCRTTYHQLNSMYNEIKIQAAEKENGNICMDLVDLMNATRTLWSRELHCLPIRHSELPFFVSASLLLITPVVFYVCAKAFSKNGTAHPAPSSYDSLAEREARESDAIPSSLSE